MWLFGIASDYQGPLKSASAHFVKLVPWNVWLPLSFKCTQYRCNLVLQCILLIAYTFSFFANIYFTQNKINVCNQKRCLQASQAFYALFWSDRPQQPMYSSDLWKWFSRTLILLAYPQNRPSMSDQWGPDFQHPLNQLIEGAVALQRGASSLMITRQLCKFCSDCAWYLSTIKLTCMGLSCTKG